MLRIAWSEEYTHHLPEGHRFPMLKYSLLPEQLIYEGTIKEENLFKPGLLEDDVILLCHDYAYLNKLKNLQLTPQEIRKTGFPLSLGLVKREIIILNGTLKAALFALEHKVAMNIAGGTHHAFRDSGEGFCLLNDIAVAASYLLENNIVKKILVVDLDVHQGNGTASIFKNEPRVFTFSMHGANNYPARKEPSDLDIALPDKTDDKTYLHLLEANLFRILENFEPEFIFYLSGVDVLETDKLGKLSLSIAGCKERDRMVFHACKSLEIPVAVCMGGGYSEKITDIVEAHANTFRLAQEIFF